MMDPDESPTSGITMPSSPPPPDGPAPSFSNGMFSNVSNVGALGWLFTAAIELALDPVLDP
jgi:hypothetical protein